MTLNGRTEAVIENYKGILEYTPEKLLLRTKHSIVEIVGSGLLIVYYSAEEMLVRGEVDTVNFL